MDTMEVAVYFGVSKFTIRRMVNRKINPLLAVPSMDGRGHRFRRSYIENLPDDMLRKARSSTLTVEERANRTAAARAERAKRRTQGT